MAQRSIPRPSRRFSGRCRIKSVRFISSPRWSKRCWGLWPARARAWQPSNPNCAKGRPSTPAAKQAARTKKRLGSATRRVVHPSVSVRPASPEQNRTQDPVARHAVGCPSCSALRAIMEQVYALFDRRCRTQTALDKLAKLRRRVQRFTRWVTR